MICKLSHRYDYLLSSLPDDQGGGGRHKCAGCALEAGMEDSRLGLPKRQDFSSLNESQAGTGRHKSVKDAYDLGYANTQNHP